MSNFSDRWAIAILALVIGTVFLPITARAQQRDGRFDGAGAVLPDMSTVDSSVTVSNIGYPLSWVRVALYLTHTSDSDLTISLIAPDGTTAVLANRRGGNADNFGTVCDTRATWDYRTVFDDAASTSISSAVAPFVGRFKPEQSLAVFQGKSDTAVNGTWKLRVADTSGADVGALQCWTLSLWSCPGGGPCANADLGGYWTALFYNYQTRKVTGSFYVRNYGSGSSHSSVTVRFYISTDNVLDPSDRLIKEAVVGSIDGGQGERVTFRDVAPGVDPAGKYVLAVVDVFDEVRESDETNNTVPSGPIQ